MFEKGITKALSIILVLQIIIATLGIINVLRDFGAVSSFISFPGVGELILFFILAIPSAILAIIYFTHSRKGTFKSNKELEIMIAVVIVIGIIYYPINAAITESSSDATFQKIHNNLYD